MYPSLKTATLEEKQSFLRSQIIDAGVDAEAFMIFMGIAKGEGKYLLMQARISIWRTGPLLISNRSSKSSSKPSNWN